MDAFKSMLYNNGYPLYVYNDASDVDLKRRGTKKDPGAMKLIIKKMPAPDATNDGGAEDGKTVDELFLAFGGTLTSRRILGLASRLINLKFTLPRWGCSISGGTPLQTPPPYPQLTPTPHSR